MIMQREHFDDQLHSVSVYCWIAIRFGSSFIKRLKWRTFFANYIHSRQFRGEKQRVWILVWMDSSLTHSFSVYAYIHFVHVSQSWNCSESSHYIYDSDLLHRTNGITHVFLCLDGLSKLKTNSIERWLFGPIWSFLFAL